MMAKILEAIDDVLGIVPPLVWALLVLAATLALWHLDSALGTSQAQLAAKTTAFDQLAGAVKQQKAQASAELTELTAQRDAAQTALNDAHRGQEIRDETAKKTIAQQATRLAALARAGRLRDPNAASARCGDGGGGAQGDAAASAPAGAGHPAEAGGLLSVQLSGLLQRLTREADAINAAYASCRPDALTIRGLAPAAAPN